MSSGLSNPNRSMMVMGSTERDVSALGQTLQEPEAKSGGKPVKEGRKIKAPIPSFLC